METETEGQHSGEWGQGSGNAWFSTMKFFPLRIKFSHKKVSR